MALNKTMQAVFKAPAIEAGELARRRRAAATATEKRAVDLTPALTPNERLLLLMLCELSDRRTSRRFARQTLMAEEVGLSRSTVIRTLARLELLGWVSREKRYRRDGTRTTDMMSVHPPKTAPGAPDRLLPLVSLIHNPVDYVPPCDMDYVSPCDLVPPKGVSRCDSISLKDISLRGREAPTSGVVDKRRETDPAVVDGMMDLLAQLGPGRRIR